VIIIFGYSKLTKEVLYLLSQDNFEFILIEPNEEKYQEALKDENVKELFRYECFDDEELLSLNIDKSSTKALFCLHEDFNKNLFVTLSGRSLNKNIQIISLSSSTNETKKLKLAGTTNIINPYDITGMKIFRELHKPIAVKILDDILYSNSDLKIEEICVEKNSIIDGIFFKDLEIIKEFNLILLGIKDIELTKNFIFSSQGINHKIDKGDVLVVLGKDHDIKKLKIKLNKV
jgi:voltage-gated potassium channel